MSNSKKRIIKFVLFGVLGVLALILILFAAYSVAYAKKVFLNQTLGSIQLSGDSKIALAQAIKGGVDDFLAKPLEIKNVDNGKTYQIDTKEIGLSFDVDKTTDKVWLYGRGSNYWQAFIEQIKSVFVKTNHSIEYSINADALNSKIATVATELDSPESDYSIVFNDGKFSLNTDRKSGQRIDQTEIIENLRSQISDLKVDQYPFALKSYSPRVTEENAQKTLADANAIISAGDLTLKSADQSFTTDSDTIGGFIISKTNGIELDLVLNSDRVVAYIAVLAKGINVAPVDAKLAIDNGTVGVFSLSVVGKTLDQNQTKTDIENALFARIGNSVSGIDPLNIVLKIAAKEPNVTSDTISKYGIKELVGTATTDFKTSPANRVHNITIGAASLNGVLLAPGEEFSTLSHLGVIDASTGYLEELVIKNDKTVPDFGGGLCQVSSTIFRASLNAGMKITQRVNHSYRVSYYEPPIGMDATIYDPSPDFKFSNNYSSHILIQSKVVGTKITFDFYGTKDGRQIDISTPVASNYVEPPAPVMVNTDTLPVGTTKLVGHSHQGATADFNYKVTSSTGEILQEKTFHSVYNAIAEQWLVGATPVVPPVPTCADGTQNGDELRVDCGGSCPNLCPDLS